MQEVCCTFDFVEGSHSRQNKRKRVFPFVFRSFNCTFVSMNDQQNSNNWQENIIVADGDYIDKVAFDLTVNFERMIGRRIPKADLARWAECVALDGGLREGSHHSHLILIHSKDSQKLQNFAPGDYVNDIDARAFSGALGEFSMSAVSNEDVISKEELFCQTVEFLATQPEVKRLMVVPAEEMLQQVRNVLRKTDTADKTITLFAMQPLIGGNTRSEILGYSLMAALGIRGDEIK